MSLGGTIVGRQSDYSPSRKPIVPSIEPKEPILFDETPERRSDESSRDDRTDRHAFVKSRPSSANTCTSETDENDYETSSEGPSRLHEGKFCHPDLLSKSHSGNLQKEEETGSSKVSVGLRTQDKMGSRQYAYVREDVSDIAMGTVSLPILRSIESNLTTTEIKDRMTSDSSFARQQKLRMIVEQTELLLSESKLVESIRPEVCYLGKKYELNRRESLMLLPVIQNVELTERNETNESTVPMAIIENLEKPTDRVLYSRQRQDHSNDLIDIVNNPNSLSRTSFYLSPYPMNESSRLETKSNDEVFDRKRRVVNDTNILLKIQGEFLPLKCELSEIAAKFRALRLEKRSNVIEEKEIMADSNSYAIGRMDIDTGLQDDNHFVGNPKAELSPITMVGKSVSRESSCRDSIGTTKLFVKTGFEVDPKDRMYFKITSTVNDSSIGNEYLGERIANYNYRTNSSPYERFYYRPGSSYIPDRYQRMKGIVRSTYEDEEMEKKKKLKELGVVRCSLYDTDFISKKSKDMNGSQYISRENVGEPTTNLLIFSRSKEIVKRDRSTILDRERSVKDLRGSTVDSDIIVSPNFVDENVISNDKKSFSNVSNCKTNKDLLLDFHVPLSKKNRSVSRINSIELVNDNTPKDLSVDSKLLTNVQQQQLERQENTVLLVRRSSQTSIALTKTFDEKSKESLKSTKRRKIMKVPKSIEKVKIVPVFFTTGIPKPVYQFFQSEDTRFSLNHRDKSKGQRTLTLNNGPFYKMSNCSSGKSGPSESDISSCYYTTGGSRPTATLNRDYFSENERGRSYDTSKMSVSCISPNSCCLSKKTSSSNALKYDSALGSICSGVARVTVSGSTISNRQKRFTQIREISYPGKGIRGMRSSPEDFLTDT